MSDHFSMASGDDSRNPLFGGSPAVGRTPPTFRLGGLEFPLGRREIRIAGEAIPLFEVPYTQATLEAVSGVRGLRERDWPYWLEDWPATYAMAEALAAEEAASLRGPVLDLGCGSGFLAAYFRIRFQGSGLKVFSCDFNRDACRLTAINAAPPPADAAPSAAEPATRPDSLDSRVFCADFNRFPSRARFGLLLAGEMLYARENQAPILAFLDLHLAPGGSAWLADPGRSAAEGFRGLAESAGWRVAVRRIASPAAGRNVDVYKLDRPEAPVFLDWRS